jgi:hypothetical protein
MQYLGVNRYNSGTISESLYIPLSHFSGIDDIDENRDVSTLLTHD